MLDSILIGLQTALTLENLLMVLIGVLAGNLIGVLPGLGSAGTIALLLPITYALPPESAIIMLAGIFYGSAYGGTITSVLLKIPGEATTIVTTFDGHAMAKKGQGGVALGISAIGSFIGGTIAIIGLLFLAAPFAKLALQFGPPEYALLALAGIILVSYLTNGAFLRGALVAGLGLLLATIGQDPVTGANRFTFGVPDLASGISFAAVAMGLFGIGELISSVEASKGKPQTALGYGRVLPNRAELRASSGPIARGSILGFLLGVLPGGGATIASMASYGLEKRLGKDRSRFGRGAIEGVAGPETANNAAANSSFIPLLSLGIPANTTMAVIFGALLLQGITPGPLLVSSHPEVFWGVIVSMFIGNIVLLALNIPLVKLFTRLLNAPMRFLAPITLVVTLVGVYSVHNTMFDVWVALAFGILGYILKKYGFEPAPLALAFVLGPLLESNFRRSLLMSDGSFTIFATSPVALVAFVAGAIFVAFLVIRRVAAHSGSKRSSLRGTDSASTNSTRQPSDDRK
ncbi:tripartite tricarboxylate transporter permease [Paramicrobacterium chengjingii]|uniref:tripartite tricarboxylate transporter permease n=1 Tax=Paramicrobacterium chengjingii TaxID=2769067 RepID=UPI002E2BA20F|nr:tripartite tricarboxylate transporter permease [Microbacterium chengjingii]